MEAELVWTRGRWSRRDYPTIMSGGVVRYTIGHGLAPNPMEVSASREKVRIHGVDLDTEADGKALVEILMGAWRQHLWLKADSRHKPLAEEAA